MSRAPVPSESTRGAAPTSPALVNGKAEIAHPTVIDGEAGESEKRENASGQDKLPLHEDVMQLARLGEIGPIQKLFEERKYSAKYKDEEDITPLHVRQTPFLLHGD